MQTSYVSVQVLCVFNLLDLYRPVAILKLKTELDPALCIVSMSVGYTTEPSQLFSGASHTFMRHASLARSLVIHSRA